MHLHPMEMEQMIPGTSVHWKLIPGFELFIFNRYGQLVFKTNRTPVAWDGTCNGKPCMNGVYTYVIKTGNDREPIKGTVMILR
ncbi:MAG: gliding motility-associated C-terminal domain-containing protein [Chitinophagaceae bacterium]|nr:gliding motility-associated C-terminal domain-containing protein [Chitinophagaceae bacterium]